VNRNQGSTEFDYALHSAACVPHSARPLSLRPPPPRPAGGRGDGRPL